MNVPNLRSVWWDEVAHRDGPRLTVRQPFRGSASLRPAFKDPREPCEALRSDNDQSLISRIDVTREISFFGGMLRHLRPQWDLLNMVFVGA
ncbi:hypothetical protein K456DRAFT_890194 [Colletotrichum gloeosporioides 23]|nr:hypothetical protein K456DRAFT_890194 [Colletotrichum gloeosporioides 23]